MFDQAAPIAFLLKPETGQIIDANKAAINFWRYSREELYMMTISGINTVPVDEIRKSEASHLEWKQRLKGGEIRDVEVYSSPLLYQGETLLYCILHDITDRVQAQAMLRKLYAAVEQSAAAVVITDLTPSIEYVNPRFIKNTGYSAEEAIGKNPSILQSGLTPMATYKLLWTHLMRGEQWSGELLNKKKSGELYWEDVHVAPIRNLQGEIDHYVAIKTDISERKQMEAALAESENRYRTLIENSPYPIFDMDLDGALLSMNRAGLSLLGFEDEKAILGVSCLVTVAEHERSKARALISRAAAGETCYKKIENPQLCWGGLLSLTIPELSL